MSESGMCVSAAICHLRVALTTLDPASPNASAAVDEPPTDWPLAADQWHPAFGDPLMALKNANDYMNFAHDFITHPGSPFSGDGGER